MLYEVAFIYKPTKKESDEGTGDEVLLGGAVITVLADGEENAILMAGQKVDLKGKNSKRLETLVRPFVES